MSSPSRRQSIAVLIGLLVVTCYPNQAASMTAEEAQQVSELTEGMTTRCVGRYLIDLPTSFVLNSESRVEVEGIKVALTPIPEHSFDLAFEARRRLLERTVQIGTDDPHLRSVIALPGTSKGAVFDRAEDPVGTGRLSRVLELQAWRDGFEIQASIKARDNSFPEDADSSIAKQLKTNVQEKLAHLLSIYERIRGRRDDEIPTQPGLCIPNGFVLGAERENQMVGFVYHLRDSRDVFFTASTYDSIKESNTLLQRTGPQERAMAASGHSVLRKGKRQIHGEEYEEFLAQGPSKDDVLGVDFNLHGNELRKQAQQPFFIYTFRTGRNIPRPEMNLNEKDRLNLYKPLPKAGLTPEQAMRLWDTVTPTIRHRPGSF
jgi:hypothetical protein